MRTVVDCVSSFIPLLSTEYEIVLGRKNVAVKLIITFDKKDCFHLMGLQYLTDRPELRRDRGKIFDEIQKGIIKKENIESSDFYHKIQDRVHFLPLLEKMLDSNDTVFKYNKKANVYSMINRHLMSVLTKRFSECRICCKVKCGKAVIKNKYLW